MFFKQCNIQKKKNVKKKASKKSKKKPNNNTNKFENASGTDSNTKFTKKRTKSDIRKNKKNKSKSISPRHNRAKTIKPSKKPSKKKKNNEDRSRSAEIRRNKKKKREKVTRFGTMIKLPSFTESPIMQTTPIRQEGNTWQNNINIKPNKNEKVKKKASTQKSKSIGKLKKRKAMTKKSNNNNRTSREKIVNNNNCKLNTSNIKTIKTKRSQKLKKEGNTNNISKIRVRDPDDVLSFDDLKLTLKLQNSLSNHTVKSGHSHLGNHQSSNFSITPINQNNNFVITLPNNNSNNLPSNAQLLNNLSNGIPPPNKLVLGNIVTISNMSNTSNGVISNASHSNSSMRSEFLGKLGRKNSYICQTLPLSNTNSADSAMSLAVSEEDGLSQGNITPIRILTDTMILTKDRSKFRKQNIENNKKKQNKMRPPRIKIDGFSGLYAEHQMNKSINIDNATELIVDTSILNELDRSAPSTTVVSDCNNIVFDVTDIDMIGDPDDDDVEEEDDDLDVEELTFASPRTQNIQQLIKKNQIQSINDDDDEDNQDMIVIDYNEDDEFIDDEDDDEEEDIDVLVKDINILAKDASHYSEDCDLNMLKDLQDLVHLVDDNAYHVDTYHVDGIDESGNIIEHEIARSYTSSDSGPLHHSEGCELEYMDEDDNDDADGYDSSTFVSSHRHYNPGMTQKRCYKSNKSAFHRTGLDILANIAVFMVPATQWRLLLVSKDWNYSLKNKLPIISKGCYDIDNEIFNRYYSKCLTASTPNQHSFLFKDRARDRINANTFNLGNNYWSYFHDKDEKIIKEIDEYIRIKQEYLSYHHNIKTSKMNGMMTSLTKSEKYKNLEKKYKKIVLQKSMYPLCGCICFLRHCKPNKNLT